MALSLCFASFVIINAVLGLAEDLPLAVRGTLTSQAAVAICLLSLAPLTAFAYLSGLSYAGAKVLNGTMFALASLGEQVTLLRHYRRLIAKNGVLPASVHELSRRHR